MIRKSSVLLVATLFVIACASDPNAKAKRGAGIGAAAGGVGGLIYDLITRDKK